MGIITDIHTNRYTTEKTTKMGKNATFHIHVKIETWVLSQVPEHLVSVIGINMQHNDLDHKLRQITNCDGRDS